MQAKKNISCPNYWDMSMCIAGRFTSVSLYDAVDLFMVSRAPYAKKWLTVSI